MMDSTTSRIAEIHRPSGISRSRRNQALAIRFDRTSGETISKNLSLSTFGVFRHGFSSTPIHFYRPPCHYILPHSHRPETINPTLKESIWYYVAPRHIEFLGSASSSRCLKIACDSRVGRGKYSSTALSAPRGRG